MLKYDSIQELIEAAESAGKPISEIALDDQAEQMGQDAAMLFLQMDKNFSVMREAIDFG